MIDKSLIDPNALHFYRMLKEAGFSAYFVGGSVRDLLLGKSPKDFDIATNATPHQIKRIIPQGRIIGRRFRHVMLERGGGRYEIVTFRGPVVQNNDEQAELDDENLENQPIEGEEQAQAPQREGGRRNYPDLNQFGTAEQDAIRRDFTINALFYDPDVDELVDYVQGKLDIDRKLIRTIGEAMQRMEEDPIRILRAIRHKMKLGLEYDAALEAAMREKAPLLEQTSKDRIREEFLKVCNDQSLGDFLGESRRMSLTPHIMPWFENVSEDLWQQGTRLWEKFADATITDRSAGDVGLALMMVPLIGPLVLEPYKETLPEGEKNYLPDMKYFLSCEQLRNYYLRNLRISRAQTDHVIRALFYYSRMTGLWLEQGPPRRIIGKLFQHPPALLAAKMASMALELDGKEVPDWMKELAAFDPRARRGNREDGQFERGERGDRGRDRGRGRGRDRRRDEEPEEMDENGMPLEPQAAEGSEEEQSPEGDQPPREREREQPKARSMRLPPPDAPMVWNGPLHAPVLRPAFSEEPTIRWARKDQTMRAYRPSGIPNTPTDHSMLKSNLVYNYKPEIDPATHRNQDESSGGGERGERSGRGGRGRDRDRGGRGEKRRGRDRDRGDRGDRPERGNERGNDRGERQPRNQGPEGDQQPSFRDDDQDQRGNRAPRGNELPSNQQDYPDEDSIGNTLRPGERPAALGDFNDAGFDGEDDIDDNIGNRLDGPPTSGHIGLNGEGAPAPRNMGRGGRPGGGGGGNRGGRSRRGGRNRRGGRGGRGGNPGGGGGNIGNRGPSRPPYDNR